MLQGTYSAPLVVVSLIVAMLAAYTALDMAERVRATSGRSAHSWLAGGAFAMGLGIWSMHFIGMLAFELPIAVGYDLPMTAASLAIAVAASALALFLVTRAALPRSRLGEEVAVWDVVVALIRWRAGEGWRLGKGSGRCRGASDGFGAVVELLDRR